MSHQIRLRLLPSVRCLFDEPLQVKVSGLRSKQVITMRARSTDETGVLFSSYATYRADGDGKIDLNRDSSLSGSYTGVEPMGLLSSLKADAFNRYFNKNRALKPFTVNFSVHEEEGRMLAEATNERFLMADGVVRVPVKEGHLSGALFIPPGEGPFPAVLDLSSFVSEKRAALLANKGFIVLSVSVFSDKPYEVTEMHLDRFEEAVHYLNGLPQVGSKGVGVISRSKAADIALSLSAFVSGIKAVVWINGCCANSAYPLYYKTKLIFPGLMFDPKKMIPTISGAVISKYSIQNHQTEENRATVIPIEKANSQFLFVASEDDLSWDSKAYMDEMVERLKRHGKQNFETVSYPGAGHYLEPPYGPHCPASPHAAARQSVLWGGEPSTHNVAEVHLWEKVQKFFKAHLSCDAAQSKPMT
ncbi:acyl-coenzyme A thioesterase 5 [Nematolebias whitei]|uniref:acyl-coenzyme A thioesterase 5 n=1 Tax=Nematolebias whitei TaxID=451745 RepID=UPI001898E030|nr:acyl-coenzyme A thioesterase 5 [Nematolebias whitei]